MTALPVARLFGLEIRIHVSWALILAVIAVTVATQLDELAPTSGDAARWLVGFAAALLFLLTAVAHELGHAIVARRAGMPTGPLVVYFYGSAASPSRVAERPRDEILAAVAGPFVSLALGAVLVGLAGVASGLGGTPATMIAEVALVVGLMNLILGGVNLLPAFPLDGGLVARGLAWWRTGDPDRGLRIAAKVGRRVGVMLALAGFLVVLMVNSIDGLMLALCGWFLHSSGRAVERNAEVDAILEGIHVSDVMERDVSGVPPGLTLDTFGEQLLDGSASSLPVMRGDQLVGMLGTEQVRRVRRDRWPDTHAEDLMITGDALPAVAPSSSLRTATESLRRSGLDGIPVLEAGVLAGILTRRVVADAIRARMQRPGAARP
jgi:Zn-dependent protease/predicted transcriptional regulator